MLLVYSNSYRILDLEKELISLILDEDKLEKSHNIVGVGNSGIYDMIIFGSGILLVGINNIMRAYDRNLLFTVGPYPILLDRLVSRKSV